MPPDDWGQIYQDAGAQYGLDPDLLRAVVTTESGGDPTAVSSKGAIGPAQMLPQTARSLGVQDPTKPEQAIPGAAKLLRENFDRYGDPSLAIMAYHGGTDTKNWGPKTKDYLSKVTNNYNGLKPAPQTAADAASEPDDQTAAAPPPPDQAPAPSSDTVPDRIAKARAAGFSDDQIAQALRKSSKFGPKFDAAIKDGGFTEQQIYQNFGLNVGTPSEPQQGFFGRMADKVGDELGNFGKVAAQKIAELPGEIMKLPADIINKEPVYTMPDGDHMTLAMIKRRWPDFDVSTLPPPEQNLTQSAIYKAGQQEEIAAKKALPVTPEEASSVGGQAAGIVTGIAPAIGATMLAGPVGGATVFGLQGAADEGERATDVMGQQAGPQGQIPGMLQPGNIDLGARPQVKTPEGGVATVRSISINVDGKEVLIPTVSPDGKLLSNREAIDLYKKTGQQLGVFDTPDSATAYAKQLHEAQQAFYTPEAAEQRAKTIENAEMGGTALNTAMGLIPVHQILKPFERDPGLLQWAKAKVIQAAQSVATGVPTGEAQAWLQSELDKAYDPKAGYDFDPKRIAAEAISFFGLGLIGPTHRKGEQPAAQQPSTGAEAPPPGGDTGGPPAGPDGNVVRLPGERQEPYFGAPPAGPSGGPPGDTGRAQDIIDYANANLPGMVQQKPAVSPTTPEPAADIAAQVSALVDKRNPKDAVFIAAGNEDAIPTSLPKRVKQVQTAAGTLLTTDPAKAKAFKAGDLTDDDMAGILGYPQTKADAIASGTPLAVQGTDAQGNVVAEALASPDKLHETAAAIRDQIPDDGKITVATPEEAQARRAALTGSINTQPNEFVPNRGVGNAIPPSEINQPGTGQVIPSSGFDRPAIAPPGVVRGVNTSAPEGIGDRLVGNAIAATERGEGPSFGPQSNRLFNRPTGAGVQPEMGTLAHNDQVGRGIVQPVSVDMMDNLVASERSPDHPLSDNAVLQSLNPADVNGTVGGSAPADLSRVAAGAGPAHEVSPGGIGAHGNAPEIRPQGTRPPPETRTAEQMGLDGAQGIRDRIAAAAEKFRTTGVDDNGKQVKVGSFAYNARLRKWDMNLRVAEEGLAEAKQKMPIGENANGHPVYENAEGVRSYKKDRVRVTEPVQLEPTRSGLKPSVNISRRDSDFLTKAERDDRDFAALKEQEPTLTREEWEGRRKAGMNMLKGFLGAKEPEAREPAPVDHWAQEIAEVYKKDGAQAAAERFKEINDRENLPLFAHNALKDKAQQAMKAAGWDGKRPDESVSRGTPEKSTTYGEANKVFTKDAAERAREILKQKLSGNQINSGFDPEVGLAGLTLAGFHIEAGARKFADYSNAMIRDLGEAVRPYLRGWYENVRHHPGFDAAGMSDHDQIAAELQKQEAGPTVTPEADRGIQGSIPVRDEGTGAEDVHGTPAVGETRPAPAGQEPGGPRASGPDTGQGTEGQPRPGEPSSGEPGGGNRPGDTDRVPGTGERTEPGAAARPAAERPDADVQGQDYRIEPGTIQEARGPKAKARDNIAAIELSKRLIDEGRLATKAEQEILAKYVGWGGLPGMFEKPGKPGEFGKGFEDIGPRLRELLSPEEHKAAARSTQYAHYTAEHVIRSMWDAVRGMGFEGGSVFEPGMGIGHFLGMMPGDLAGKSEYQGIEFDPTTANIAKLLYPESGVRQADFTKTPMPENQFDLVIGNPPFGDITIKSDPKYAARNLLLHDYFFAKSLDSVRPGGLMAFVTSAGTMNKMDSAARRFLAERADFVGGVRLPSTAFKKNAGTEVTTDILFFKRRPEGRVALEEAPAWTEVTPRDLPNAKGDTTQGNVNRYFSEHPEQVLGQEGFFDKLYKDRYAVHEIPGSDLTTDLKAALDRLPKDVMTPPPTPEEKAKLDFASGQKKDGSFYMSPDGRLMQYSDGAGRQVGKRGAGVEGGFTAPEMERIKHLIPLRDALRDVFRHDLGRDPEQAAVARAALNEHYDRFVDKFGPINKAEFQYRRPTVIQQESARLEAREEARAAGQEWDDGTFDPEPLLQRRASLSEIAKARQQARDNAKAIGRSFDEGTFDPADMPDITIEKRPNIQPFMSDPESYRMRSIEKYNDATGEAEKKRIFEENILTHDDEPKLSSANDGVLWSLNKFGRLDLDKIAERMNQPVNDLIEELGDKVFKVPGSGDYQTADHYLSGDVVSKMQEAQAAAEGNPVFDRNVAALKAAIPAPLSPTDINVNLGMPWIPEAMFREFARDHLKLGDPGIVHSPISGKWLIDTTDLRWDQDRSGQPRWSTDRRTAYELLSDAMNRTPPRIYDTIREPDGSTRSVFNEVATQAAHDRLDEMKQAFQDWVNETPERADGLAKIYNDKLNRVVLRQYDGSYMTTPGVSSDWKWRPHQTRVVSRIVQDGNTYMAHAVGAGKTSAMIGAGMEMKRLGLVSKPMYVVPNHMLGQFTKEFYEQYPTARIAVADERRFHTDKRKQFVSDIAQDDLDAVIITHSGFGKIPISDEFQAHLIEEEIEKLDQALAQLDKRNDRLTVKNLQKMKEGLEQRLEARGKGAKDLTNTFEELGADFVFVDEAHLFRKLSFATQQSGLKGITPQGSNMAWDLYTKLRYLDDQKPGRSAVLASGTPITNTMGELYTLSRYMQRQALEKQGLSHFDSWAQTFGDTKTELEPMPDGSYKPVTRFSKFVNMPELFKMVGQIMDVVTPAQLEQYVTRPKLKGGQRQLHIAPFTDDLAGYQSELASRMKAIAERRGPPNKGDDILLSVINDGRHSAIDPRFVMRAGDDPSSKLNEMIANVARIHAETKNQQFYDPKTEYETPLDRGPATQMIFSNLGINGRGPTGFSGYQWMKSALIRAGVPAKEIAFIGDYSGHIARQALFNDVNAGKVRVLIGSTQKMGTGVNAQKRLYALHNLDPLWYPSDDEQRVGRILRQGNTNPEIEVHDYTTQDTYDRTMWGMMGRKGRFIEQFFRGDPELRDMEDLGEAGMYEQAAAMATSDPRIFKLTDLKQELEKAQRRESAHERNQYSLRQNLAMHREDSRLAESAIEGMEQDLAQRQDVTGDNFSIKVGDQTFTDRKEAAEALGKAAGALYAGLGKDRSAEIGSIGGFPLVIRRNVFDTPEFYLDANNGRRMDVSAGKTSESMAVIRSAEYRLRNLETDLETRQARKEEADKRAEAIEPLLGQKFAGKPDIERLKGEVAELQEQLKPKEEPKPGEPTKFERQRADAGVTDETPHTTLDDGTKVYSVPGTEAVRASAEREMNRLLQKAIGLDKARVRVVDHIETPEGEPVTGATTGRTIHLTLRKIADMGDTLNHETIHFMKDAGLLPGNRWKVLENAAKGWRKDFGIDEAYAPDVARWRQEGESEADINSLLNEEAIAAAASKYGRGDFEPKGLVGQVLGHVGRFWEGVSNYAKGLGFKTASGVLSDIREGVHSGETGAAARVAPRFERPEGSRFDKSLVERLAAPIRRFVRSEEAQKVINSDTVMAAREAIGAFADDVMMKVSPNHLGSENAKKVAKDFANEERRIAFVLSEIDKRIKSKYSPDERKLMGFALDEQSVMEQKGDVDPHRGLGRLTPDQRALVDMLDGMSQKTWESLQEAGIVKGQGLPHYMPRYFVNVVGTKGRIHPMASGEGAKGMDRIGYNLRTAGPKHRKYLTPEESEAAAKAHFGDSATLVTDIRTLLSSMQRSQRAIAGRELIRSVKEIGNKAGIETVSDEAKPDFFTIDHPAFTEWRPAFTTEQDGKVRPKLDQNGEMVFERRPIYVSREFEGPLRAVLNKPSGAVYNALMQVKNTSVGLIMMSPMTHNMVIYGKAFPLMPGKMITLQLYRDGYRMRSEPGHAEIQKFISAGMVPINGGWMHDVTGIAEEVGQGPGRSLVAKGLGNLAGAFAGEKANQAVRRGIDTAGHFLHETLLWDRIADLQAGIAKNMHEALMAKGLSDHDATLVAAHLANRYAGAMPREALSDIARKTANLTMFSRSFTLGNLGIMKDMIRGVPADIRAQLSKESGVIVAQATRSAARRVAIGSFIKDLGMFYGMNALVQMGIRGVSQYLNDPDDSFFDKVGHAALDAARGYGRRWHTLTAERAEHPLNWLNPLDDLAAMLPSAENEPGKTDRIFVGLDKQGRGIYAKNPFGKVGEEFKNYMTSPLAQIKAKLSPFIKPITETVGNRDYYGHKIYDDTDGGMTGAIHNLGDIIGHWMVAQVPLTAIKGGADLVTGEPGTGMSSFKSLFPLLTGVSVSQGNAAGPQAGIEKQVYDRYEQQRAAAYPKIIAAVNAGRLQDAQKIMMDLGEKPAAIATTIKNILNPQKRAGPTGYLGREFKEHATPEDIRQFQNVTR